METLRQSVKFCDHTARMSLSGWDIMAVLPDIFCSLTYRLHFGISSDPHLSQNCTSLFLEVPFAFL